MKCKACLDTGHVCENHPGRPWDGVVAHADACGCGAGMPCPACCILLPQNGVHSILENFIPIKYRSEIMIKPTVGRIVWFYSYQIDDHRGPFAAIIARVHSDTKVNLAVFTDRGWGAGHQNVPLVQPGSESPKSNYCTWVPYQVKKETGVEDDSFHRLAKQEGGNWTKDQNKG